MFNVYSIFYFAFFNKLSIWVFLESSIHEVLKLCLNLLIGRLPQVFITNIKIDFNKIYLTKTIGEIYHEFNLLPTFEEILKKNLIRKGKINLLNEIYYENYI